MKVLLVVPKVTRLFEEAPLGIMYIAAVLKNAGHFVEIIEGNVDSVKSQLVRSFKMHIPEVVGFSCATLNYRLVMYFVDYIGDSYPDIPIVVGGPHATIMPETLLLNKNIDYCAISEAEFTMLDLCNYIKKRSYYVEPRVFPAIEEIDGLMFMRDGNVCSTHPREPILDLDSVPFPARELLDQNYFKNRRTTLIASRGCPYNCSYCQPTLRRMFGSYVRRRSVKNVIDEMKEMHEKYGVRYFKFVDDTFTADRDWTMDFCDKAFKAFRKVGKHIDLDCLTRVNEVDEEILKAMKKAGFYVLDFGVECGSQRILNYYRKGITVKQSIDAVKMCKKAGIRAHTCLMIGAPIETMEDINETKRLIKKMNPDSLCVAITTPMPHTAMWDGLVKDGVLSEQDWFKVGDYLQKWGGVCQNISEKELFRLKQEIQRNFWLRKALNPKLLCDYIRYHDSGSFRRAARYFLLKGDYS